VEAANNAENVRVATQVTEKITTKPHFKSEEAILMQNRMNVALGDEFSDFHRRRFDPLIG